MGSPYRRRAATDPETDQCAGEARAVVEPGVVTVDSPDPRSVRRRPAYRALSNLRTTFSQHFADPSPTGVEARILWPLVVAMERILDETIRLGPERTPAVATELRDAADALETLRDRHPGPGGPGAFSRLVRARR